jgi:hypothetical protein
MIVMTSATSSMTEGVLGQGHRPFRRALQCELPCHQGGERSTLCHDKFKPGPINKYDGFNNPE